MSETKQAHHFRTIFTNKNGEPRRRKTQVFLIFHDKDTKVDGRTERPLGKVMQLTGVNDSGSGQCDHAGFIGNETGDVSFELGSYYLLRPCTRKAR